MHWFIFKLVLKLRTKVISQTHRKSALSVNINWQNTFSWFDKINNDNKYKGKMWYICDLLEMFTAKQTGSFICTQTPLKF